MSVPGRKDRKRSAPRVEFLERRELLSAGRKGSHGAPVSASLVSYPAEVGGPFRGHDPVQGDREDGRDRRRRLPV